MERLKELSQNLCCEDIANVVLNDDRFYIWSASPHPDLHHYGDGGLYKHTLEVVELSLKCNEYLTSIGKGVQTDKLYLAALFHDIGKVYDYEKDSEGIWVSSEHKKRIYHICKSALIWHDAVKESKLDWSLYEEEVLHAILSHHGRLEWKSPVTPQDRLSWILHLCDNMSARTEDCFTRK